MTLAVFGSLLGAAPQGYQAPFVPGVRLLIEQRPHWAPLPVADRRRLGNADHV